MSKYQFYLSKLHSDKLVSDSIANLRDKAQTEQKLYEQSLINTSQNSKFVEAYDFATILLIIGAGLGGISEIATARLSKLGWWRIWSNSFVTDHFYDINPVNLNKVITKMGITLGRTWHLLSKHVNKQNRVAYI